MTFLLEVPYSFIEGLFKGGEVEGLESFDSLRDLSDGFLNGDVHSTEVLNFRLHAGLRLHICLLHVLDKDFLLLQSIV